jgi:hypothetical protein
VRSRTFAVILENKHIAHSLIPLQVNDASYMSLDDMRKFVDFKFVQTTVVSGCFHDDLVCPHAVHQIVKPFRATSQFTFDPQSWVGIGDYSHRPTWSVGQ